MKMFRRKEDVVSGKLKMLYNEKIMFNACRLLLLERWNRELYASL
jgi:hypothetical protein